MSDDRTILRILRAHRIKVVWFVTCRRLDPNLDPNAIAHQAVLKEIVAEGHVLGNHGYSHVDLTGLTTTEIKHEIADCSTLIERISGVAPRYFRPPWGRHNVAVENVTRRAGMTTMLWTANSYDSLLARFKTHPPKFSEFMRRNPQLDIASNVEPGDVVLLHDYPNTALALEDLLRRMELRGMRIGLPGPNP
jgi:peptidoglycan/xylan/chitin deacetylase (PgdA/CDA1 family)